MPLPSGRDQALAWFLRILGVIDLCALLVVFLPDVALHRIHRELGLATLPVAPQVSYLIRSVSVLYALHGGLMLGLASDVTRYRPVIRLLGCLAVAHGILLSVIDQVIGMPAWWTWTEGPIFVLCGIAVLTLSRHESTAADANDAS